MRLTTSSWKITLRSPKKDAGVITGKEVATKK
jgi:hypothetical protein